MFRIYGGANCSFCKSALTHIETHFPNEPIDYMVHEHDPEVLEFLRANGLKKVPQIIHMYDDKEVFIGGFDKLQEYTKEWYGGGTVLDELVKES